MHLKGTLVVAAFTLAFSVSAGEVEGSPFPYERVFKSASHVVVARTMRVTSSGGAYFQITEVLRTSGDLAPRLVVGANLSSAPVGLWPGLDSRVLLALKDTAEGYALEARGGAILPAEPSLLNAVRSLLGTEPARRPPDETHSPPLPEEEADPPTVDEGGLVEERIGPADPRRPVVVKVKDTLDSQAWAAEVIAIGQVVEVALAKQQGDRAILRFVPEEAVKGGGLPRILEVHIPSADPAFAGTLPPVRVGRYCLFLVSRPAGKGLDLVSPYFGTYQLKDDAETAKFKEKLYATEAMQVLKGKPGPIITTLQALTAIWQEAWNEKDLARLMVCYSRAHPFYRMYHAGGEHRTALERRLMEYPAKVHLKINRIEYPDQGRAEVHLDVVLEVQGAAERRDAVMKTIREEGEWRIVEEGF